MKLDKLAEAIWLVSTALESLGPTERVFVMDTVGSILEQEDAEQNASGISDDLDQRILDSIGNGATSAREVATILDIDRSVVQRRVSRLIATGLVHARGTGPSRTIRLPERVVP